MSADLKQIVSKNIADLRVACKMTQLELGQALSYSDKAVSKWERGEAVPDAYVLLEMSKLFGVTVDYILTKHGENDSPIVKVKPHTTNHLVVTLIALTGVYAVATLLYIILSISDIIHPQIYVYATVAALIVLTVMNSMWGKRIYNLFIISALIWGIILTLYLVFSSIGYEWKRLLFLGIPAQVIVCLCFGIKKERIKLSTLLKKHPDKK